MPVRLLPSASPIDPEQEEINLLLESVYDRYGIDFRDYAYSALKRRIHRVMQDEGIGSLAALRARLLDDPEAVDRFQARMTLHVTAMFRDPSFFLTFRRKVVPVLRTYPYLRLWVAGCSTGEEVYSLAILLHEEGLQKRCRIYATDISDRVLEQARSAIFPLASMQEYTRNYQQAGGDRSFAEYYTADSDFAIFRPFLRENILFAPHNLVGDASFNEFHAIFCRNVMIYFKRPLQERVHSLFYGSLLTYGYLGLGRSETIRFSAYEECYEMAGEREKLYRKIK